MYKSNGFTLIETMIVVTVLAIIAAFSAPIFATWMQDSRTRTVAESLQNGIRLAQSEAVNKGRQVAFYVTTESPSANAAAESAGSNWGVRVVAPTQADVNNGYIQGAVLKADGGATVMVNTTNPEIRFNSIGRLVNTASQVTYNITNSKGARKLNVRVSSAGSVRMCDPDKVISSSADGC